MTSPLLLDTHALIWLLTEPGHIPETTLDRIQDPGTSLLVSVASAWEIATKFRLGKLDDVAAVMHGYPDHLVRLRAAEVPITGRHALTAGSLNWDHRDPFDRMIAAQSLLEATPLVTADKALQSFPGITTIW